MRDILAGLLIISRYEPDSDICASHDQIMVGGEETKENATPDELAELEGLGWLWDEEYDCYMHFT